MGNTLKFKRMISWETAKNRRELDRALKKIAKYGKRAIDTGQIVKISLKEMEDPLHPLTQKDRVALGFSGICAEE